MLKTGSCCDVSSLTFQPTTALRIRSSGWVVASTYQRTLADKRVSLAAYNRRLNFGSKAGEVAPPHVVGGVQGNLSFLIRPSQPRQRVGRARGTLPDRTIVEYITDFQTLLSRIDDYNKRWIYSLEGWIHSCRTMEAFVHQADNLYVGCSMGPTPADRCLPTVDRGRRLGHNEWWCSSSHHYGELGGKRRHTSQRELFGHHYEAHTRRDDRPTSPIPRGYVTRNLARDGCGTVSYPLPILSSMDAYHVQVTECSSDTLKTISW